MPGLLSSPDLLRYYILHSIMDRLANVVSKLRPFWNRKRNKPKPSPKSKKAVSSGNSPSRKSSGIFKEHLIFLGVLTLTFLLTSCTSYVPVKINPSLTRPCLRHDLIGDKWRDLAVAYIEAINTIEDCNTRLKAIEDL